MIKSIYFDLDGVLIDSRDLHYKSLNLALNSINPKYVISREEHLSTYDGLSTTVKLELLTINKNLPIEFHKDIWRMKQEFTTTLVSEMKVDVRIQEVLRKLKEKYTIYVASNAIYNTVKMMLLKKGLLEYIDYFISNEDVSSPKPSPEIYLKCLVHNKISPNECVIIEDSPIGRQSAYKSGCHVLEVEDPKDVTFEKIESFISGLYTVVPKTMWKGKMNVLIPMSGAGSRFEKEGYIMPKPLIDVNGKPMIQVVVENLNCDYNVCQFIYIVQKSHYEKYMLKYLLNLLTPNCKIIITEGITEGAACSALLATEYINTDDHLLIANSDQFLEWNSNQFYYSMVSDDIDGGISTFTSTEPKWSFAKLDPKTGFVSEVAEKKPISDIATTGIYYWKKGSDFVKYTNQMISKNIRVNNEFYICPVFNEAIGDGKKIKVSYCKRMLGLGTPADLTYFLDNYDNNLPFSLHSADIKQ